MIRINLLPYREKEKKANIQSRMILHATFLSLFLLVLGSVYFYFSSDIDGLRNSVREEEAKLAALNRQVGEIEALKRNRQEIEQKLAAIRSLERDRLFPVRMLDELNMLIPARDLWLERITQTGSDLRIEGVARNNDVIARFLQGLQKAGFIRRADLIATREKEIAGSRLQQFIVTCTTRKEL